MNTRGLSRRDAQLYGSFRLDQPLSASSNGKYIAAKWEEWAELKRADIAKTEANDAFNAAHKYQNNRAGTRAVVTTGNRGTSSFPEPQSQSTPQPKSEATANPTLDEWISKASSQAFKNRLETDSDFAAYVNR